jgi:hypothetical protein
MRQPFYVSMKRVVGRAVPRVVWTHPLILSLVAMQTGSAMGGTATKAVLSGDKVRVEADLADGHLRERYLAKINDDASVEVATSDGVNGIALGTYNGAEMEKGITVPLKQGRP